MARTPNRPSKRNARRPASTVTAIRPGLELSPAHRAWIVENLIAGVAHGELAKRLASQISLARAKREVAAGTTNDFYMVSNNHTLKRKRFRELLGDVKPPRALFHPLTDPGAASLWIGPAGTRTPLHHDTTNILFCQIHGRKRVELISP